MTTAPEIITEPETEATHYGIPVCHIGDDGDMLALGHPGVRRALAAFNRHARVFCHLANLADDQGATVGEWEDAITEHWVIFRRPDQTRGDDPDCTWYFDRSREGEPGAVPVTLLDVC